MHYDFIGALEVTYGNALAAGGGFHRVTTAEGSAAEVTPLTYLWYKLTPSASATATGSSSSSASGRQSPAAVGSRKQLASGSSSSSSSPPLSGAVNISAETARGITQLRVELEDWTPPSESGGRTDTSSDRDRDSTRRSSSSRAKALAPRWTKMDKPIDRQRGLFVWYQSVDWTGPPSPSSSSSSSLSPPPSSSLVSSSVGGESSPSGSESCYPLKEIRVVRELKDVPEGFECLREPIVTTAANNNGKELCTFVCYRRLSHEDFSSSKWSIATQKAGNWIEVKDASASNRWSIAQIVSISASEIRVNIATWRKGRDEYLTRATCRPRVAKLGTHVNLYMSPSYPFTRKHGSMWHVGLKDLQQAREDFDSFFYDLDTHGAMYVTRHLIPFIEKSLLCQFFSAEMADEMNAFHQHVLKNVVAKLLSTTESSNSSSSDGAARVSSDAATTSVSAGGADVVTVHLLALLRMILNGHSSCMFFYVKYPGAYSASKYQKLVYTSYLASPDALVSIPTRHPCRSFYFVDNVDLFIQAGGFRVILQRLALPNVTLPEVALFCALLYQAKPCVVQHKRRRSSSSSSSSKRRSASSVDAQVEDFFRDFIAVTLARLRRMTGEELKDDSGLVDHIVGMLDMLYRDGVLLGGSGAVTSEFDADEDSSSASTSSTSSSASCDAAFAEAIEVFHLDLSKKLICCPYLAQRLLGIARLNDLITMAQRREDAQKRTSLGLRRTASSSSSSSSSGSLLSHSDAQLSSSSSSSSLSAASATSSGAAPVAKWLRVKYVVEWLAASDVLEVIVGDKENCAKYELPEGTHLELLKRSKKIYTFVAANALLNEKHLVLLWKTGMGQLRSGRKAVFDMLITLCGIISADLIDVVMVLLTQVPLSEYDELLLQFVRRIVVIAAKQVVDTEAAGTKKTLSALVGVSNASKLSASAQRDVDVLNKVVNLGCCLLWNAILDGYNSDGSHNSDGSDGASLRPAMRAEVESVLATSLNYIQRLWAAANSSSASSKEQQRLLSEYLKKCAENIQRGVLVETSMSLIQRVVDGYGADATGAGASSSSTSSSTTSSLGGLSLPRAASFGTSARMTATPSELLKDLNAKYDLVRVVAEEIRRYMAAPRGSSADSDAAAVATHLRSMRRRLAFLGYIVTKSEVELSYALMEQLWRCCNGAVNTPAEREVFFEWLTGIIPDPSNFVHRAYAAGHSAFASGVPAEMFQSLIVSSTRSSSNDGISLDVRSMGTHAFWAFERLFRLINTNERALSSTGAANSSLQRTSSSSSVGTPVTADDTKSKFVVESFGLKGLEMLYEVALCAGSDAVSHDATNYLISLHLHVGSKLVRREVWADFVAGCFARLEAKRAESIDGYDDTSATHVHRLLVLLGTFLYQSVVQSHAALRSGESSRDAPEELVVHVRTQDGRAAAPFRYQLKRTSLVGELRDRIAADTGHPADRVRIVNEFRTKLTAQGHDKFTLEKARVFSMVPSASGSSSTRLSAASTAPAPSSASAQLKRVSYVEAIMLVKVESDTVGHVQRVVGDTVGAAVGKTNAASGGADSDWHAVKAEIASSGQHVELLFALLAQRGAICEEAWKVLKLLAADTAMEKRTRTLNDTLGIDGSIRQFPASFDWDAMLDLSCAPKLLYQLELVERFAIPSDVLGSAADSDDKAHMYNATSSHGVDRMLGTPNRWSESFLKLGGKVHLSKFVLACSPRELVAQGSLSVTCLSKLLKLLRHLVLVESRLVAEQRRRDGTDGNESDDDAVATSRSGDDPQALIYRLLETLEALKAADSVATDAVAVGVESSSSSDKRTRESSAAGVRPYSRPVLEDVDNVLALPSGAYLMTRTLSLIATCALTATRDALPLLESYAAHGEIVLDCLVQSAFRPVRQETASLIAALATTRNSRARDRSACCRHFLELLSAYSGPVGDAEYYTVFTLLVSSAESLSNFDILGSCRTLCRRIKSFTVCDDLPPLPSSDGAASLLSPAATPDAGASDSLLEALLSTLLTILKRIPPVLAGRLDVPYRGRSLREVVATTLHEDEAILDEVFHRCLFATPETTSCDLDESSSSSSSSMSASAAVHAPSSQYYLQKPKCRSESARDVAFALLTELVHENASGLRYLLEQMSRQHSLEVPPVPKSLAAEPPLSASRRKSTKAAKDGSTTTLTTTLTSSRHSAALERAKYVGLKNLGCTCYLNSTMQLFFMIPRFRRQILRFGAAATGSTITTSESKGVLYELQSLFAHLEGTAKAYYNPRAFVSALKTWDGERLDVNVQQDASEFLTSFFQQLESEMNGVGVGAGVGVGVGAGAGGDDDESVLSTFFGGVFSNELVADGGRYSERAEPFHFISVPVRDRKTLTESLDGWVEGEKVSYTWEPSDGDGGDVNGDAGDQSDAALERVTLETHKRISIAKLPDQLLIHLKRFEFDFERMQQLKLHDRFEFPMELDMYPYTKAGQAARRKRSASSASTTSGVGSQAPSDDVAVGDSGRTTAPEYSQYELVGTVVHMGSAHSGHYYSFLREQDMGGENTATATRRWYEFNDTVVTPFDPQQLPAECFGGEDDRRGSSASALASVSASGSASASASATPPRMKTRSSFMLLYARKRPTLQLVRDRPLSSAAVASSSSSDLVGSSINGALVVTSPSSDPSTSSPRGGSTSASSPIAFGVCALVVTFCRKLLRASRVRLERLRRVAQVIAPKRIRDLIAMENRRFWRKTYLHDTRCLRFTHAVVRACIVGLPTDTDTNDGVDSGDGHRRSRDGASALVPTSELPRFEPPEVRLVALQTATKFVFGTLWQSLSSGSEAAMAAALRKWEPVLLALYQADATGCLWLLRTLRAREALLLELLVFTEHAAVRELLARVLAEAIATTSSLALESDAYEGDGSRDDAPDPSGSTSTSGTKTRRRLPASFEFVFWLVQLLPALLTAPAEHQRAFFVPLWDFVQTGRNEGAFLVVNSVVGALAALLAGLGSTQPLLQPQLARVAASRRQVANGATSPSASTLSTTATPTLATMIDPSAAVLKLLSLLLRVALPPAIDVEPSRTSSGGGVALPTNMAHDHLELPAADKTVLLHESFVALVTARASRYGRETKALAQIVAHVCWESRRATALFLDAIMRGIEAADHHDVKAPFRTLSALLKVRDSLASERLRDALTQLLTVMAAQQRFYKATEVAIEMLTRLAKRHSGVARWLQDHHASCAWLETWLVSHRGTDGWLQQRRTVLVKPGSTSSWASVSLASAGLHKTVDRAVSRLLPRVRALLDPHASGSSGMEAFYDSDDNPMRLVGKRVRVKWAKDRWYDGRVERFDDATHEHFVVYDDGDERSYRMSEKQFYVVESGSAGAGTAGAGIDGGGMTAVSASATDRTTPPSSGERAGSSSRRKH